MKDIVVRLQRMASQNGRNSDTWAEAADEIKRLRIALVEARTIAKQCHPLVVLAPWPPDEHERMKTTIAGWEKP